MPVRRVRRRYLYVRVNSEDIISEEHFTCALADKIHFLYGVTGSTEMNYRLIEWDYDKQSAIIRVNHTMLTEIRAALAHIQEVNSKETRLDVLRVSGTIKTLKSKLK
jgi:RNase P/RNase MRP subunit POP5